MIKKIFFLVLLFSSSVIFAQEVSSSTAVNENEMAAPRHFGSSNPDRFHIGTPDYPVTVKEFCSFINTYKQEQFYHSPGQRMVVYDATLMSQNGSAVPNLCIQICRKNDGVLWAFPTSGCENDIIDAVSYDGIYKMFSLWRVNPTMGEVTEYLNDELAAFYSKDSKEREQLKVAALSLKNRYQSSPVHAFEVADHVVKILIHAASPEEYQFADMIVFSKKDDDSQIPIVALCGEENFFYRYDMVYCINHPYELKQSVDGNTTVIDLK